MVLTKQDFAAVWQRPSLAKVLFGGGPWSRDNARAWFAQGRCRRFKRVFRKEW